MKVLVILCVFIATVTASYWIKKRETIRGLDCGENIHCSMLYSTIKRVMKTPHFELLVDNVTGQMNLDCSPSTFSDVTNCGDNVPVCTGGFSLQELRLARDYFCQNEEEAESLNDCLNNVDMPLYFRTCRYQKNDVFREVIVCVGRMVAAVPSCGPRGGAFFLGLFNKMMEAI